MRIISLILLSLMGYACYANNYTNIIKSIYYQQTYCSIKTPENSVKFLKENAKHAVNYCPSNSDAFIENQERNYQELVKEAEKDPKNYAYLVGLANIFGLSSDSGAENAEVWFKKGVAAGSNNAKLAYAYLLSTNLLKRCVNYDDPGLCTHESKEILKDLDNSEANTLLMALYPNSLKFTCEYAVKAVQQGSLNAYPSYTACETDNFEKPITSEMKQKLNEVITNKMTSIAAKKQAAKLLGNKKELKLLDDIKGVLNS